MKSILFALLISSFEAMGTPISGGSNGGGGDIMQLRDSGGSNGGGGKSVIINSFYDFSGGSNGGGGYVVRDSGGSNGGGGK